MKKIFLSCAIAAYIVLPAALAAHTSVIGPNQASSQSIQIMNLLANTNLPDPGMTATPIIIKYYNGMANPCWVSSLNYQTDTTVHAGPGLGCVAKITEIIVSPMDVAEKLKTYKGPIIINIDPLKFAYQITIVQDQAPEFDAQSGLVLKSGTITYNSQAMYN